MPSGERQQLVHGEGAVQLAPPSLPLSAADPSSEPDPAPPSAAARASAASRFVRVLSAPCAPCACCVPKARQRAMRALALAALVPGLASLVLLGVGSLATMLLRLAVGPFVLLAFRLTTAHLYPTPLGRLHLVGYAAYKWWTRLELHSRTTRVPIEGVAASVFTIACFVDNYAYLLVDESGEGPCAAALVDPAEAAVVLEQLRLVGEQYYEGRGLRLDAVLTTHKHWDHQGGNVQIVAAFPAARVYGGRLDDVAACTHPVRNSDVIEVGSLQLEVIDAPGHTLGSVMFLLHAAQPVLFTGDTIFCGGCGAPMEGTMDDLLASFARVWRRLSPFPNALIFPGHEYTEQLLASYMADPASTPLDKASAYARLSSTLLKARRRRAAPGLPLPTVPTCLQDELAFNPYFATLHDAASTLADAYRRRLAREDQAGGEFWKPPPPSDGDDYIPTIYPWEALAPDEPPRSHMPQPAHPPVEGHDRNPTLVLVSSDVVRSLAAARVRRTRAATPRGARAALARSAAGAATCGVHAGTESDSEAEDERRESAAFEQLRQQRAHTESGADDWAAKRSRRLRAYLAHRRALGEEATERALIGALSHFGLADGHIAAQTLVRALTTLGVAEPLTSDEARALVRDARAIDLARAAASAPDGFIAAPPVGTLSARALVELLGSPPGELRAHHPAEPTLLDRAVGVLARLFPMGGVPDGERAARDLVLEPAVSSTADARRPPSTAPAHGLAPAIDEDEPGHARHEADVRV